MLIFEGTPGAPYPFLVKVNAGEWQRILLADFPSLLQLLEQLAPLALAGLLTAWREEERDRRWEKQQRKERKRKRKLQQGKKAKALRELVPVSR